MITTIASWKLIMLFIFVFLAGYCVGHIDLDNDDEES